MAELGCEAHFAAADAADADQLAAVVAAIPAAHPLGAVIHTAAVLADTLVENLDHDRVEEVLRPKLDAAVHLHHLTETHNLTAFILFSSVAGVLGNPGQANYAAATRSSTHWPSTDAASDYRPPRLGWGLWGKPAP